MIPLYYEGLTLAEIGQVLGCHRVARVPDAHQAVLRLRAKMQDALTKLSRVGEVGRPPREDWIRAEIAIHNFVDDGPLTDPAG